VIGDPGYRYTERCLALQICHAEIIHRVAAKFNVGEATVRRWVKRIYKTWQEQGAKDVPMHFEMVIQSTRLIFQAAMECGDLRSANAAIDRLAKIFGLFEPEKLEVRHRFAMDLGRMGFSSRPEVIERISEVRKLIEAGEVEVGDKIAAKGGKTH